MYVLRFFVRFEATIASVPTSLHFFVRKLRRKDYLKNQSSAIGTSFILARKLLSPLALCNEEVRSPYFTRNLFSDRTSDPLRCGRPRAVRQPWIEHGMEKGVYHSRQQFHHQRPDPIQRQARHDQVQKDS